MPDPEVMLTAEEISRRLKDRTLTKVADATGLSYPTVWRVANGQYGNVEYKTILRLSEYLKSTA